MIPRHLSVIAAFTASLSLLSPEASADSRLRTLVFEDCAAAGRQASELSGTERGEFITYLTRVLTMQAGVPAELLLSGAPTTPLAGGPQGPVLDTVHAPNMWQIFEPSRELRAKQCAAQLLTDAAPQSFSSVPTLIDVLQNPALSGELREPFEAAVWAIVLKVKQDPAYTLDRDLIEQIVARLVDESTGYLAGDVLFELRDRTVTVLSEELFSTDEKRREALHALLLRFDRDGTTLGARLLDSLNSTDAAIRQRSALLLGELNGFRRQSLPPLLMHLADPSPEVSDAVWHAIARLVRAIPPGESLVIDDAAFQAALAELATSNAERRLVAEQLLGRIDWPDLTRLDRVWELTRPNSDEALRECAMRIVVAVRSQRKEDGDRLLDALYDSSLAVRLLAVEGLAAQTARAEEVGSALLRVVKSSSNAGSEVSRGALLLAVSNTLLRLPPVSARERLVPYLVDTLALSPAVSASFAAPASGGVPALPVAPTIDLSSMELLTAIGHDSVKSVSRLLKSPDTLPRRRALAVLARIDPADPALTRTLLPLLADPNVDVRRDAVARLPERSAAVEPDLRKLLGGKDADAKTAAALVLARLGKSDPEIVAAVRDAFSVSSCTGRIELLPDLLKVDPEFRAKVQPFLAECVARNDVPTAVVFGALEEVSPLSPEVQSQLFSYAGSRLTDRLLQRNLLDRATRLGVDSASLIALSRQLLQSEDSVSRGYLLESLARQRDLARALLPELRQIAAEEQESSVSRVAAVVAIANVDSDAVDFEKLLLSALDSDRFQAVLAPIGALRPELAVPLLSKALRKVPSDRRAALVAHIGKFGLQAVSARESLEPFLKSGDAFLRYQAAIVLIRTAPEDPDVARLLRGELVGRYAPQLGNEELPKEVMPAIEQIVRQPRTDVEQQAAEQLLRTMKAKYGESPKSAGPVEAPPAS